MPFPVPPEREVLEGCRAAHVRLLEAIETLDEAGARAPSRLPGWSRAHVLAHLARNADSHRRVLDAAGRGEAIDRYPGGASQRTAEIEDGARRPADELVDDVRVTTAALEASWESTTDDAWAVVATSAGRLEPVAQLPWKRWREVEIHHADLGLAFTYEDWSPGYVRRELQLAEMAWRASRPMGLTGLPAEALRLPPATRLAWLVGRLAADGLPPVPQWF